MPETILAVQCRDARPPRPRKPVVDPNGVTHESVTAAARAMGWVPSTVSIYCSLERNGWRFATADEALAAGFKPFAPTAR